MNAGSTGSRSARALLDAALSAHRAGALGQAEAFYRQALAVDPANADGLHLLGTVLLQSGRPRQALDPLTKAIDSAPGVPDFWNSRGAAHYAAHENEKAAADYARAVALKPDYAAARLNLGRVLSILKRHAEAIETLRKLSAERPRDAVALDTLGTALLASGRADEAISVFKKAVELAPRLAAAHCHLGTALLEKGNIAAALRALRRAVSIDPTFSEAHFNLAAACQQAGKRDDALAAYRLAVEFNPLYVKAWNNLGLMLRDMGEKGQAIAAFKRGTDALQPGDAAAAPLWNNIGSVLMGDGEDVPQDAVDAFRRAIALDPMTAKYHRNLALVMLRRGDSMFAMQPMMRALELDPSLREDESLLRTMLFLVLNEPDGVAQSFRLARQWNETAAAGLREKILPHLNARVPDRPLRIGYVSPDFRRHSVAYFIEPVLRAHDRTAFDVTCYAELPDGPDEVTERLKAEADRWWETKSLSDDELAARIREDRIDILVDLAGHTGQHRLLVFAHKPAPVQVSWIGFPATTGLDTIDWRLTDSIADPPGRTEAYHSERLWRLPGAFLCYVPSEDAPPITASPYKQNGRLSFGSFNNGSKIRDSMLALWARATKAVPGSRLVLKNRVLSDAVYRKEIRDRFRKAGGDPAVLVLHGHEASHVAHLKIYEQVDIALDTFPYNGATTTCEALWMGVPVVTLAGDSHVSRVGASLLTHIGLADLVAGTEEEYMAILTNLAVDHERRDKLRASLRPLLRNSILGDPGRFTRGLENAYRAMWRKWCESA